jgi:recombining binding protein (suppressor of hairless)
MNADTMYSHASYTGSVPSFSGSNGNPYDIISGMPSSYSNGKAPPLTSSDSVGHLPHLPAFSSAGMTSVHKEYTRHTYPDPMPDRRLSSMGTHHYQTDYPDEYVMASGITHTNTVVPTFSGRSAHERSLRFPSDPRFPSVSGGSHTALPDQSAHASESLGAVPPQVTQSYRPENARTAYDDYSPVLGPSHDGELPHHMPPVDESLARMKLHTHSIAGPSNDLQTFIRSASFVATKRVLLTPLCSGPTWNNMSAPTIAWRLVNGRLLSCLAGLLRSLTALRNGQLIDNGVFVVFVLISVVPPTAFYVRHRQLS